MLVTCGMHCCPRTHQTHTTHATGSAIHAWSNSEDDCAGEQRCSNGAIPANGWSMALWRLRGEPREAPGTAWRSVCVARAGLADADSHPDDAGRSPSACRSSCAVLCCLAETRSVPVKNKTLSKTLPHGPTHAAHHQQPSIVATPPRAQPQLHISDDLQYMYTPHYRPNSKPKRAVPARSLRLPIFDARSRRRFLNLPATHPPPAVALAQRRHRVRLQFSAIVTYRYPCC